MPVYPEEIYSAAVLELKDIIAPSALQVTSNYIKIGNKKQCVILLRNFFKLIKRTQIAIILSTQADFGINSIGCFEIWGKSRS